MITERQLSILNAIVEDYVDFGQPIGSKTLIHRHNLEVSPCLLYTSPSPRDGLLSRMPSSA